MEHCSNFFVQIFSFIFFGLIDDIFSFWNFPSFTAKRIWDDSIFSSIKPKLDMGGIVRRYMCIYLFLHDVLINCFDLQNNSMSTPCKNQYKQVNTQKSTNLCQVLAKLNKILSGLIFIKLYTFQKVTLVKTRYKLVIHAILLYKDHPHKDQY